MKAAEGLILERTDGDTDPMLVYLARQTDTQGIVNVGDAATVIMSVRQDSGDTDIPGAAEGGGTGRFAFPVSAIDAGKRTDKFDIKVTEAGVGDAHYARGKIVTKENIGA